MNASEKGRKQGRQLSPEQAAAAAMVAQEQEQVNIDVPGDRESTFEPHIVKKRQRRLGDVDEIVLSLYAKGMTTGRNLGALAEIYGASVSKEKLVRSPQRTRPQAPRPARRLPAIHPRLANTRRQQRLRTQHPHDQTQTESLRLPTHPHRSPTILRNTQLPLSTAAKHGKHYFDTLVILAEGRPWLPTIQ